MGDSGIQQMLYLLNEAFSDQAEHSLLANHLRALKQGNDKWAWPSNR